MAEQTNLPSFNWTAQYLRDEQGKELGWAQAQSAGETWIPLPGGATAIYAGGSLQNYWHSDWLGSARFGSTPGRTMFSDQAYAPFGEPYASAGNTAESFASLLQNLFSDLYDTQFREYHPTQGRWITPDPAGKGAADPGNPQSWNRYAYVENNPVSHTDPTGLIDPSGTCWWCGGSGGMMVDGLPDYSIGFLGWNSMAYCPKCTPGQMVDANGQINDWYPTTQRFVYENGALVFTGADYTLLPTGESAGNLSGLFSAPNNGAQAIESIFSRSVSEMDKMGVRRTGSGTLNGVLNNLQSWYKGCWGCGDQANYLMLQLQASGPSGWQYITQGVDPVLGVYTHYITVALPDYPGNPVIFMDPWRNEINVVGPPQ
jgi:RHS repeat-associated protein